MIYSKNASVDVLVARQGGIFGGEHHNVVMTSVRVYYILSAPYVVCGVVDSHDVVSIHPVILEMDAFEFSSIPSWNKVRAIGGAGRRTGVFPKPYLTFQNRFDPR
jgi:hypothetical protein